MSAIVQGITMLLAKFAAVLTWIGQLFVKCWVAAWDLVRDAACWPFDQGMQIVVSAVNSLDTSALNGSLQSWGSLPADLLNILGLLGVGTAVGIISAAIGIRLTLQLIPFTRLGS